MSVSISWGARWSRSMRAAAFQLGTNIHPGSSTHITCADKIQEHKTSQGTSEQSSVNNFLWGASYCGAILGEAEEKMQRKDLVFNHNL